MARKKQVVSTAANTIFTPNTDENLTKALGDAFNQIIQRDFGHLIAPPPIITPTGIVPLDYLLGGGIVSSKPVMISSTPETGKSTFCFQFSKIFQETHKNGVIVYIDIEAAGNAADSNHEGHINRIETFGLDTKTFQYQPVVLDILGVFDLIEKLSIIKQKFEDQLQKEFFVLIVWDSLASTRASKTDDVEGPNNMIGFKARELTFNLEKHGPTILFKRMTLLIVDQVRANLKSAIDGPYSPKENTVGVFNDFRAATSIQSLNHITGQWLYFSKKKNINFNDNMGIDGWEINVFTEKNKNAPSHYAITCVFDKIHGFDKFWTEYNFISDLCPSEAKLYKKSEVYLKYPLCIVSSGAYNTLKVVDPNNHKNVLYKSDSFYKKDAKKLYETNQEFHDWFDYAVNASSYYRIVEGLFQCQQSNDSCEKENLIDEEISEEESDESLIDTDLI